MGCSHLSPALAARWPEARFLTVVRSPLARLRSTLNCVLRFDQLIAEPSSALDRIYQVCLDGRPVPAVVRSERPRHRPSQYSLDHRLEDLGIDPAAVEAEPADYSRWCQWERAEAPGASEVFGEAPAQQRGEGGFLVEEVPAWNHVELEAAGRVGLPCLQFRLGHRTILLPAHGGEWEGQWSRRGCREGLDQLHVRAQGGQKDAEKTGILKENLWNCGVAMLHGL